MQWASFPQYTPYGQAWPIAGVAAQTPSDEQYTPSSVQQAAVAVTGAVADTFVEYEQLPEPWQVATHGSPTPPWGAWNASGYPGMHTPAEQSGARVLSATHW